MSINNVSKPQPSETDFDLFRLGESKVTVNLSPNTLRSYNRQGLPFYGQGRTIFVSKKDLAAFLKNRPTTRLSENATTASTQEDSKCD
jgi:hypothetical protein